MGAAEEAIHRREQSNYEAAHRAEVLKAGAAQEALIRIDELIPVVLGKWAAGNYFDGEILTRVEPARSKSFGRTKLRESEVAGFKLYAHSYYPYPSYTGEVGEEEYYLLNNGELAVKTYVPDDSYKHSCADRYSRHVERLDLTAPAADLLTSEEGKQTIITRIMGIMTQRAED